MARMGMGSGIVACGLLACIGAASAAMSPHGASPAATAEARQLTSVVRAAETLGVPGGVIGVTGGRAGHYQRAFGRAGPGWRMALNDHFRIGSVTKTFTATVILALVDRHVLSLGDRLSKWEPHVPNARHITIAMLLGMRSGIWDEGGTGPGGKPSLLSVWAARHCNGRDPACSKRVWAPQQIVNLAIRQGPAYPPGTWYYSDTNYVLLAIIAHDLTHQPFAQLVRRLVLNPLHLRHTSFPVTSTAVPKPAAVGYVQGAKGRYERADVLNPSATFGAGNMISTLGDLQRWSRAFTAGKLLSRRTRHLQRRLFLTPAASAPLAGTGATATLVTRYGLGLADLSNMLGHNGFLPVDGYSAEMWSLPHGGTLVELLNSVAVCQGEFLADALNSSLAQVAFGRALYRTATTEVHCTPAPGS
jgi:D-alanyl-D-alanine carboxypeptidase